MEGTNSKNLDLNESGTGNRSNQSADGEVSSLRSELKEVITENSKLRSEISSLVEDMGNLRNKPSAADDYLAVAEEQNSQLRAQVVKMIKDLDSIQNELNKAQSDLRVANDKANSEDVVAVKKLQKELIEIQKKLNISKGENEKLRSDEEGKTDELSKVQNELTAVREKFDELKGENEKLRSREGGKSDELTKVQAELGEVRKNFELAKGEVEKLRSEEVKTEELSKVQTELTAVREKFDDLKRENEKLRSREGGKLDELTKLQAELVSVRKNFELAKGDVGKLRNQGSGESEFGKVQAELAGLRQNFELAKAEVEKLRSQDVGKADELGKVQAELMAVRKDFELEKDQNEKLSKQGIDKGKEIVSLQTDLNDLREKIDKEQGNEQLSLLSDDKTEEFNKLKEKLKLSDEALKLEKVEKKTLHLQLDKQQIEIKELDAKLSKMLNKESNEIKKEGSVKIVQDQKIGSEPQLKEPIKDYGIKEDDSPTAKVKKLRKYRGYRNPEEKTETNSKNLLELVKEYRDRMANGESKEAIALSIAELNPEKLKGDDNDESSDDKQKAYSPNRSFGELLEDSERRKVALTGDDIEGNWSDKTSKDVFLEGFKPEDIEPMPEKANVKPLIIAAIAACLALGVGGAFLFKGQKDEVSIGIVDDNTPTELEDNRVIDEEVAEIEPIENGETQSNDVRTPNVDLSSEAIKNQAEDLLKAFHETKELPEKSAYCRVPSRALKSMESYYANQDDTISIVGLKISPELVSVGDLRLVKADVITRSDSVVGARLAFFEINEENELKLDWFNYIDTEAKTWDLYVKADDATPSDWKVNIDFNGDEHPDFSENDYAALRIRSFSPGAFNQVNAYVAKNNPKYQDLLDAYQTGQQVYIFKLRNLKDETGSFMIDDIVSLHSFYMNDIVTE